MAYVDFFFVPVLNFWISVCVGKGLKKFKIVSGVRTDLNKSCALRPGQTGSTVLLAPSRSPRLIWSPWIEVRWNADRANTQYLSSDSWYCACVKDTLLLSPPLTSSTSAFGTQQNQEAVVTVCHLLSQVNFSVSPKQSMPLLPYIKNWDGKDS